MQAEHSAEWQTLMDAWQRLESSQQTRQGTREAWRVWRAAVIAWRNAVDERARIVQVTQNEREQRRRGQERSDPPAARAPGGAKGDEMIRRREIEPAEWETFLREFNGRNYARPVRLQTAARSGRVSARRWTPVLVTQQPLVGVELDLRGSQAGAITVALGGLEAGMPQFTHVVARPTRLWVEAPPRGLTQRLTIESADASGASLVFEPAAARLNAVDALADDGASEWAEDLEALGIGA